LIGKHIIVFDIHINT